MAMSQRCILRLRTMMSRRSLSMAAAVSSSSASGTTQSAELPTLISPVQEELLWAKLNCPPEQFRKLLARERILLNKTPSRGIDDPTHIEITEETVDVVFDTTSNYTEFLERYNTRKESIPEWLQPVDCLNRVGDGAGASIRLDKQRVIEHLSESMRKHLE